MDDMRTHPSLLARLKVGGCNRDWELFYKQYRDVILCFSRRQGLDESSACDVLQETMVLLMRKLPTFEYDPLRGRFRNWLLTLVAGKVRDAHRRIRRERQHISESEYTENQPLPESPTFDPHQHEETMEKAWLLSLMESALYQLQQDLKTKPSTFAAFRAYAIEGQAARVVAERFGLEENAVYQIRNRLFKRLKQEVLKLSEIPGVAVVDERTNHWQDGER